MDLPDKFGGYSPLCGVVSSIFVPILANPLPVFVQTFRVVCPSPQATFFGHKFSQNLKIFLPPTFQTT
jgi:hypothetical protein